MRSPKYTTISCAFILLSMCTYAQSAYELSIEQARMEKDEELRSRKTSPLQKADRKHFHNLDYYPVNDEWNVEAAFQREEGDEVIEMPTSAGYSKKFKVYGILEFSVDGEVFRLLAYKRIWPEGYEPEHYHPSLFVPFKDLTSGEETYGGGRYMDIEIPEDDRATITLDFNTCYNPYCAYGGGFACPIPPEANFINKKVPAGERAYSDDH